MQAHCTASLDCRDCSPRTLQRPISGMLTWRVVGVAPQITDLPSQTELQRYMSGVSLRTVPFRPKVVVPTDLGPIVEEEDAPHRNLLAPPDPSRRSMADELEQSRRLKVRPPLC